MVQGSKAEQEAVVKAYVKTRSRTARLSSLCASTGRSCPRHARRLMNEAQFVKWAQSTEGET